MSTNVDQRVVEMKLDADKFERGVMKTLSVLDKLRSGLNFDKGTESLQKVYEAASKIDLSGITNAVENVKYHFSALEITAITVLSNIVNSAFNAGKRIVSALTIDPITTGFREYETKINSIQTILANTEDEGATLRDVNAALDELNVYADKTIYNFTEMTKNIGTFTAAGVDLQTATRAIQGMANVAAVSGANAEYASRAMYQMSQALATGTVRLMDWRSMENASMGGEFFQTLIKDTAADLARMGKLDWSAKQKKAFSDLTKGAIDFRSSLAEGWLTADIMTAALNRVTKTGAAEYLSELTGIDIDLITQTQRLVDKNESGTESYDALAESMDKTGKITKQQAIDMLKLADTAENAATKVRSITQLWDTLKEAAQSGWTTTWQILIGDFEEAKSVLTEINDAISDILNRSAMTRNLLLQTWKGAGALDFIASNSGSTSTGSMIRAIGDLLKEQEDQLSPDKAQKLGIAYSELAEATGKTEEELRALIETNKYGVITYEELIKYIAKTTDFTEEQARAVIDARNNNGRMLLIEGLKNSVTALYKILTTVKDAFTEIFPPITAKRLYDLTVRFKDFTETLIPSASTLEIFYRNTKELSRILKGTIGIFKNSFGYLRAVLQIVIEEFNKVFDVVSVTDSVFRKLQGVIVNIRVFVERLNSKIETATKLISANTSEVGQLTEFLEAWNKKLKLRQFLSEVFGAIRDVTDGIKGLYDSTKKLIGRILPIFAPSGEGFSIVSFLDQVVEKLTSIISYAREAGIVSLIVSRVQIAMERLGDIFDRIAEKFNFWTFLENVFNSLKILVLDMLEIGSNFFALLTKALTGLSAEGPLAGIMGIFNTILSGGFVVALGKLFDISDIIGDFLETFSRMSQAKLIKEMGIAIGILALSLILLSKVPTDQLVISMAAIGGALEIMVGVMGQLMATTKTFENKISGSIAVIAISQALIGLATAVLILAAALYLVSLVPADALGRSLLAIMVMLAGMAAIVAILNGTGNGKMFGLGKKMEALKPNHIGKALNVATSLIALAATMLALTGAVVILGLMPEDKMYQGLKGVSILLAEMVVIMAVLSSGGGSQFNMIKLKAMIGMMSGFITSMIPVAAMVVAFGAMDERKLTQGLIAVSGLMIVLTTMMYILGSIDTDAHTLLAIMATMLAFAISVTILVNAFMPITKLDWGSLLKAGVAMIAVLGILAVGLAALFFLSALPADMIAKMFVVSAALFIFSQAVLVISVALRTLAKVGGKAWGALALIAATMLLFVGIAVAVSSFTPALLAFSVTMVLLAASVLMLSTSLMVFASAIAVLAALSPAVIIGTIGVIGTALIALIPQFLKALVKGINDTIVELTKTIPILVNFVVTLLVEILRGVAEHSYEIGAYLMQTLVAIINAVADNIEPLLIAVWNLVVATVQALIKLVKEGVDWEAIGVKWHEFWDGVWEGICKGAEELWEKVKDFGRRIIDGICEGMRKAAEWMFPQASKDIANGDLTPAMASALLVNSPSKLMIPLGESVTEGIAVGMLAGDKFIKKAAGNLASATEKAVNSELDNSKFGGPSISPVVSMGSIRNADLQLGASASAILATPVRSLSRTMYEAQAAMDARNVEVMSAVKSLQADLKTFVAMDQRELSLYVDSRKLASTIVNPMNRELNVIARRSEGI